MGKGENPHTKSVSGEDIDFELVEESYPIPIISPYDSQVHYYRRDQFPSKSDFHQSRTRFDSLSPHLQNTLFHPKHIRKLRSREVMEKFVVFAELKNAGNVEYRKGELLRALSIHEQVYGLFRYLEMVREGEEGVDICITDSDFEFRISTASSPQEDKLLRDMLSTTLLNMSACALRLNGYPYSHLLCSEAIEIQPEYALAYARRAQSTIANLESSVADLEKAAEDAEKAVRLDPRKEFKALLGRVRERITTAESQEKEFFTSFFESVKKLGWIEPGPKTDELELEHLLIKKMLEKYHEMLKFYEECEKRDKLAAIRQEMKVVAGVYSKMNWIHRISVSQPSRLMEEEAVRAGVDLHDEKVGDILDCVKRMSISSAFSGPKYNDQLVKYCIDLCTSEGLRRQRQQQAAAKPDTAWCGWWTWAILIGLVAWGVYYIWLRRGVAKGI